MKWLFLLIPSLLFAQFVQPPLGARLDLGDDINRGLEAYWPFSDGPGTSLQDISGFQRNGSFSTLTASDWSPGMGGYAINYGGGSSDLIDVGSWSVVSSQMTICAWVYLNSTSDTRDDRFVSKADGTAAANHDWMFGLTGNRAGTGNPGLRMRMNRSIFTLLSDSDLPEQQWVFCVGVYDNGSGQIYQNTTLVTSPFTSFNSGTLPNNTNDIYIGNQPTSTSSAPDGYLSNIRIYNRVLSQIEIERLYVEQYAGFYNYNKVALQYGEAAAATPAVEGRRRAIIIGQYESLADSVFFSVLRR